MSFVCICVYVPLACLSQRGKWNLQKWSWRWLWATKSLLKIKSRSFAREKYAFNHWTIFQVVFWNFNLKKKKNTTVQLLYMYTGGRITYINFCIMSTHTCMHPSMCVEYTSELNNLIGHSSVSGIWVGVVVFYFFFAKLIESTEL